MSDDYRYSAFWQDRYEQGTAGWDKGQAAPPLVRALAGDGSAPGARVLVPGCGYGHEALHLARLGYQVVAIDFAPAAVARLRQRAADLSLEAVECDIFALPANYNRLFDLVVEHTCFCAIPLDRRDDYARVMARVLRGRAATQYQPPRFATALWLAFRTGRGRAARRFLCRPPRGGVAGAHDEEMKWI